MLTRDWGVGTAVELVSLAQRGSQHSRRDAAPLAAVAPFRRSQSCRNLFRRRVPVDTHGAGGSRNWANPVTKHRNAGGCSECVAHFFRGLHDALWLCREHQVFARISSKCRCAKCERKHDARASNRRTAQAIKSVFYSHAVIVIPFRILGKLIQKLFETKKRYFQYLRIKTGRSEATRVRDVVA